MKELFLDNSIFIFLLNAICFFIAFWVYFTNRKVKVNQLFFLIMISIILWTDFNYIGNIADNTQTSVVFKRLNFAAVCFFFIFTYFFSVYFPKISKKRSVFLDKITIFTWSLLCFFTIFTDLIIKDVKIKEWGYDHVMGKIIYIFYFLVILFTFLILFNFFKKYFTLSYQNKLKIQYFLTGAFIFALFNLIFNVIFPLIRETKEYYQFGDYSVIFPLILTTYAIVKRELFDIKVVLTSIFVGLIAILLLIDVLASDTTFDYTWKGAIFVLFLIFGYMLIKSVVAEVKRRKELEKLSRAKSEFISMASHQLRTPLTAIKGYSSLILEGTYGEANEKQKKVFKNIFTSSERLIKIVNDLLSISKIELGKVILEKEPVRIEKLIESVYQEMRPQAQEKGLKLIWQKSKQALPEINIDSLKIRQAIFNIIDNAIKYTEKGNITIKIQNLTSPKGKPLASYGPAKIQIVISDTGRGFTKEEENRVFELFVRGRAGIDTFVEGTGIGLNVARKFVELHNGKIRAESEGKDKGAIFYIELPVR